MVDFNRSDDFSEDLERIGCVANTLHNYVNVHGFIPSGIIGCRDDHPVCAKFNIDLLAPMKAEEFPEHAQEILSRQSEEVEKTKAKLKKYECNRYFLILALPTCEYFQASVTDCSEFGKRTRTVAIREHEGELQMRLDECRRVSDNHVCFIAGLPEQGGLSFQSPFADCLPESPNRDTWTTAISPRGLDYQIEVENCPGCVWHEHEWYWDEERQQPFRRATKKEKRKGSDSKIWLITEHLRLFMRNLKMYPGAVKQPIFECDPA